MAEKTKPHRIWADMNMGIWLGRPQSDRRPEPPTEYVRADSHDNLVAVLAEWIDAEDTWDGDFADDDRIARAKDEARAALASLQTQEG